MGLDKLHTVAATTIASCSSHATRGECVLFREQHLCVWDEPSTTCVDLMRCEDRDASVCETELTTGAVWDHSTNMCFYDTSRKACRWSDECFLRATDDSCSSAGCAWVQSCTPEDFRAQPGPNVCTNVCTVPSASTPPRRVSRTERSAVVESDATTRSLAAPAAGPIIQTTGGVLQGITSDGVDTFLGVPFAEAPVGDLRFAPPSPLTWAGTYAATANGPSCAAAMGSYAGLAGECQGYTRAGQAGSEACRGYSEDCLNLNVYAPSSSSSSTTSSGTGSSPQRPHAKRAVMVWIHGGCFVSGSAAGYNGTQLAKTHGVVVVVIQYRLGVFGFLGGEELRERDPEGSTGNWGLLDNVAALKWVHSNIAAFGGDPDNVMIFGESSGAGSVSQLLGIEAAWPYFHKAVMESGTAAFWTYLPLENAQQSYTAVLASTGCASALNKVDCLLGAGSNGFTSAVTSVPCRDGCTWAPTIDGVLIPDKTLSLGQQGYLRPNTPMISGFNLNDGAMFVPGYPAVLKTMSAAGLQTYFSDRFGEEHVAELATTFPVPGAWPGSADLSPYCYSAQQCETDFSYACTALWLTAAEAAGQATYVYLFSEPTTGDLALHGDEIKYVFGTLKEPSASQTAVSEAMMTYWTNFAKTGNPNDEGGAAGSSSRRAPPLEWPVWDAKSAAVLNITSSPIVRSVPVASYVGCPFFQQHWAFYSGCLPPPGRAVEKMAV